MPAAEKIAEIYLGHVIHRRFAPRRHFLRYALFQLRLDIGRLPEIARTLRLFSHNRFGLFSFHERDHGDGRERGLRAWVDETLRAADINGADGEVTLLAMPRILGHVFNPLSVYFCRDAAGALKAIVYEVNNTFGERHFYVFPATEAQGHARHSCAKAFHVSPFMEMAMTYDFDISTDEKGLAVRVDGRGKDGAAIIATCFSGRRERLTDAAIAGAFIRYPLMTLKVVSAIHFEAARLLFKGVRMRRRPSPPSAPVTVVA